MTRKFTAICLILALCCLLLASCGKTALTIDPTLYPASGGGALTALLDQKAMCALTGLADEDAARALIHTDDQSAFRSLISGENKLIFVSSEADEAVKKEAMEKGVGFSYTVVAYDALVFYVNAENPIQSLTKSDLARIYSGDVTDWRELSGDNCPIDAFYGAENDFYTRLLADKIMAGDPPAGGPGEAFLAFDDDPLLYDLSSERADERPASYRNTPGAIAYGSRFLLWGSEKERGISLLSLNGAAPTAGNLTSGKYDLTYAIYAVVLTSSAPDSTERSVIDFLLSREGKNVIKEAGYAPVD